MKEQEKRILPLMIGELVTRFVFFMWLSFALGWSEWEINTAIESWLVVFIFFVLTTQVSAVIWWTTDKRLVLITGGKMLVDIALAVLVATYWLN
jgi:hypothetical protein